MQILILAHLEDPLAMRVYAALRARHGEGQVKLVSSEELVLAPHWSFQLSSIDTRSRVTLHDGSVLQPEALSAVFNRLRYVDMPHFNRANQDDRDYAVMEMYALLLSWLTSLPCPVINRADPRGLGARQRSRLEWLYLAGKAGLPVEAYAFSSDPRRRQTPGLQSFRRAEEATHRDGNPYYAIPPHLVGSQPTFYLEEPERAVQEVLVAGERCHGQLAGQHEPALRRLADRTGCDLLQVTFALDQAPNPLTGDEPARWRVRQVTAFPQTGDPEMVQAIASLLEQRARQGK